MRSGGYTPMATALTVLPEIAPWARMHTHGRLSVRSRPADAPVHGDLQLFG